MKFPRQDRTATDRRSFLAARPYALRNPLELGMTASEALIRAGRNAMACRFEVLLPASQRGRLMQAHRALDEVDRLERQLTVYRDDSEVAEVNRTALKRPVELDADLFRLLRLGTRLSRETGGAFDMTAAPLTRCWGFFARQGRIPTDDEIETALEQVGWREVELDHERRTIRFRRPLELNLGGIGKGWALDRAAEVVEAPKDRSQSSPDVLLHAGHSSIVAFGDQPRQDGWRVSIRHPLDSSRCCALLQLRNQALAVSGVREQNFLHDGRTFGHIIDPRTGRPAQGTLMAAAVAPSAVEADALSTAFFVMTQKEVDQYCRRHGGVGALVATAGQSGDEIEIRSFNLDEDSLEVLC